MEIDYVAILLSLIVTVAVYAAFPMIYLSCIKKETTIAKYRWICYAVNFVVCCIFATAVGGTGGGFLIWTIVFTEIGISKLKKKGLAKTEDKKDDFVVKPDMIKFVCDNCGEKSKGWYQTCPACGADGKLRKGSDEEIKSWNTTAIKVHPVKSVKNTTEK